MAQSTEYPDLPLVVPRSFTEGRKPGCPKLIVMHYTAGHEGPDDAENGAAYDQRRTDGTSTHYFADSNSVIQCVYTWDEAHTARSHGNDLGIHYELCGTNQTREQWLDAVSDATLTLAARQAARDAKKYDVPVRRLSVAEVRVSHPDFGNEPIKGFCGHADITLAFPEDHGTHLDPGEAFPWDVFLARVEEILNGDDMDTAITWNTGWLVTGLVNNEDPIVVPPNPTLGAPGATIPNKLAQAIAAVGAVVTPEQLAEVTAAAHAGAVEAAPAVAEAVGHPLTATETVEAARQGAELAEDS